MNKEEIQESIDNINAMRDSHIYWAEYFENNPDIEKKYVKTGDWDTAKEHRNIINQYDKVLDILKSFIIQEPLIINIQNDFIGGEFFIDMLIKRINELIE